MIGTEYVAGPALYPLYVATNSTFTIPLEVGASLTFPHFTDEETEMQRGYAPSYRGRSVSIKNIKCRLGGHREGDLYPKATAYIPGGGGREGERKESEILFVEATN